MKSITVHGLDDSIYKRLKEKARAEGLSLNRTTKGILQEALGVPAGDRDHRTDFEDLHGTWSADEVRDFQQATAGLREVDPEDW